MRDKDLEQSQKQDDDFTIEMIDLDTLPEEPAPETPGGNSRRNSRDEAVSSTPSSPPDKQAVKTHISLRTKLTGRQRIIRVVSSAIVIIVALLLILNNTVPVHSLFGLLAGPTPTATATLVPNIDHFYLDASPPWGKLTLDGHDFVFSTNEAVQLTRGHHQFVWQASPFRPIRCTLSVPIATSDTCKHIAIAAPMNGVPSTAQEVTFYDTLNMLPSTQQAALIQTAQKALDAVQSTTTVQPGEPFVQLEGNITSDIATQPLHATLHFDLSVGDPALESAICASNYNSECYFLYHFQSQDVTQNCDWFCTVPDSYSTITFPNYWQTIVIAHAYWDFTTLDGRTIARDQPDTEFDLTNSAHFMFLDIVWNDTGWQATIDTQEENGYNSLACLAANNEINEIPSPVGLDGFGFSLTSATVPAAGCVAIVQPTAASPSSSVPAPSPQAYCLYRFGILLAANPLAHRYWPHIPVANPYEQSLAKQIAATQTR